MTVRYLMLYGQSFAKKTACVEENDLGRFKSNESDSHFLDVKECDQSSCAFCKWGCIDLKIYDDPIELTREQAYWD